MNYRTIILPEALKIIQSGDPSGFDVIAGLSSILGETGQSLDSLIIQLETLHRNAVMGIKVGFNRWLAWMSQIYNHYRILPSIIRKNTQPAPPLLTPKSWKKWIS